MLQNGSSKKTMRSHFPIQVAFMLLVFIIFSFFYNEINIQNQQQKQQPPLNGDADTVIGDQAGDVQKQLSLAQEVSKGTDDEAGEEGILLQPSALLNQTLLPSTSRPPLVALDKSSTCTVLKEYSGRRVLKAGALNTTREAHGNGGLMGGEEEEAKGDEECDFFSGRWVYDNISRPLHQESDCPYMSDQLACRKHGRPDSEYQHWRWQPHNCNLKRWNVTHMWEKLRGKRLMLVGDSLNRGMFLSLVCLMYSAVPADKRSMTPQAHLTSFRAEEYNSSIEFLWAPLLVESNSDHPVEHRLPERIIRPDSTLRHSNEWKNADILIFNSYAWWSQGHIELSWSDAEPGVCEEIDGTPGMELALEAWANWMISNFDFKNKRAFFVTMSPSHNRRERWDPTNQGNCYGETLPILTSHFKSAIHLPTMEAVNKIVRGLTPQVQILNITQLSDYRKDGHPTIYRKFWEKFGPDSVTNPGRYSDCLHWCLPGVQDVWNEILFQYFLT